MGWLVVWLAVDARRFQCCDYVSFPTQYHLEVANTPIRSEPMCGLQFLVDLLALGMIVFQGGPLNCLAYFVI